MINQKNIWHMMEQVGIESTDKVTVHCSLRAIGDIENGADGLLDAMSAYLAEGLLIIPTHTWDEVVKENPYYDVKKCIPCIGTLAQVAAFRKDAVRSLHPTHSIAVFGKDAKEWVAGEENSATPAPVGGCLSRLYEENGKILLLGVGLERNTYFHAIDERLHIPNRINKQEFVITITDENGATHQSPPFHTHYSAGLPCCCSEFYPNYKKPLDYHKAITYGMLGNATVSCMEARTVTDLIEKMWQKADYDLCSGEREIPVEYYQ